VTAVQNLNRFSADPNMVDVEVIIGNQCKQIYRLRLTGRRNAGFGRSRAH